MTFAQLRARHPGMTDEQILAIYGAPASDMGDDPELFANPFVVTPDGRTIRVDKRRDLSVVEQPVAPIDLGADAEARGWVMRGDTQRGLLRDQDSGQLVPNYAYSVAAPAEQFSNDPDPSKTPAGQPRRRPDLEEAGYRPKMVEGVDGEPVIIYSPTNADGVTPSPARRDAMQYRELSGRMSGGVDYQREQRIKRYADKLGVPESVVLEMLKQGGEQGRGQLAEGEGEAGYNSMNAFAPVRQAVRDKQRLEAADRMKAWRAQMMLGGGRQEAKPLVNAWMALNDPTLPMDQRNAMRYMLPGGNLSAAVDAQNMQNASNIIQRFYTSGALGMNNNPAQAAAAEAQRLENERKRGDMRKEDEDVLGEKYAPAGWFGYDEFTVEEQQQMYEDLIRLGYKPAEAQRAVDRVAGERRASARADWGSER